MNSFFTFAIKEFTPKTKFYFAGSSEMFGKVRRIPQNELTPFIQDQLMVFQKLPALN